MKRPSAFLPPRPARAVFALAAGVSVAAGAATGHAAVPVQFDPSQPVPAVANIPSTEVARQIHELVLQFTPLAGDSLPPGVDRVDIAVGGPDARLRLADCDEARAYLPAQSRLWGSTRVGLRCERGAVRWNVFLPVTVRVWAPGWVLAAPLRAMQTVQSGDLKSALVDWAAEPAPAVAQAQAAIGRQLARDMAAGAALRASSFKPRRYFAAGDPVRLVVRGAGFAVTGDGQAVGPGDEGQCARVRTDSGRTVCAQPTGERTAEVQL